MSAPDPRKFYDSEYHYEQDIAQPDEKRIWHAMRHLEPISGTDFLDLGCGAGWATKMAMNRGAKRAVGVDFSRTGLELASRHSPRIGWVQADGTALPLMDGSFDRLFCNGALEHFPDVRAGLAEIRRVLRSNGKAVVIVPNFHVRTEQPMEFRANWWTWKQLIESIGLNIEKTGIDWGPPVFGNMNPARIFVRAIGKMLCLVPRMQYQFIFVLGYRP